MDKLIRLFHVFHNMTNMEKDSVRHRGIKGIVHSGWRWVARRDGRFRAGVNASLRAWSDQELYPWPILSTKWAALDSKPRGVCLLHGHVTSSGWTCDLVWPRKLMRKIYSPLCLFLSHQIRERKPTAHADASLRMGMASGKAEKVNKGIWSLTEWLNCWNQPTPKGALFWIPYLGRDSKCIYYLNHFFELGLQLHPTQNILTDSVSCSILQVFKHC